MSIFFKSILLSFFVFLVNGCGFNLGNESEKACSNYNTQESCPANLKFTDAKGVTTELKCIWEADECKPREALPYFADGKAISVSNPVKLVMSDVYACVLNKAGELRCFPKDKSTELSHPAIVEKSRPHQDVAISQGLVCAWDKNGNVDCFKKGVKEAKLLGNAGARKKWAWVAPLYTAGSDNICGLDFDKKEFSCRGENQGIENLGDAINDAMKTKKFVPQYLARIPSNTDQPIDRLRIFSEEKRVLGIEAVKSWPSDNPPRFRPWGEVFEGVLRDENGNALEITAVMTGGDAMCIYRNQPKSAIYCSGGAYDLDAKIIEPVKKAIETKDIRSAALGRSHGCAIMGTDQELLCWGKNDRGQADFEAKDKKGVKLLAADGNFTCIINSQDELICSGD